MLLLFRPLTCFTYVASRIDAYGGILLDLSKQQLAGDGSSSVSLFLIL
jgi:hypothetical protein